MISGVRSMRAHSQAHQHFPPDGWIVGLGLIIVAVGFLSEIADLGYAIHITELDVNDTGVSGSDAPFETGKIFPARDRRSKS